MTKSKLYAKLNAVRDLEYALRLVEAKIEKLESCAQGHAIRYDREKVQQTPSDPVAKIMDDLSGLLDRQKELQCQRADAVIVSGKLIDLTDDRRERLVLYYRYVTVMSWAGVARKMHLSERHVFRIHDAGIEKIFKKCQSMSVNVS